MCCDSNQTRSQSCLCQKNVLGNPALWSKKKKMSFLEDSLKCLQKQAEEVKESIKELKS